MGYDAYVRCNCYKEGKATNPPCSTDLIKDDDLEFLYIDVNYGDDPEMVTAFENWTSNGACEHQDMEICSERLANISGMAAFRTIISELGFEKYPILSEHLPESNGGHLPVEYANLMEQELENLKQEDSNERLVVLNEVTTNQRIQSTNSNYEKPFVFTGYNKLNYTISKNGFKVFRNRKFFGKEFSTEEFRSEKFTQKKITDKKYLFTDYSTNKTFESEINLFSDKDFSDDYFEFELKEINASIADEYAYIIEPLLKLTKASQETGNPIVWC
ncbi:hypothetical protein [Aquimarina rhabdastrellae]